MKIIGCDFHPGYQQIAMLDLVTGEMVEKALSHERKEEVRAFYAGLEGSVRVGIEASGQSQWFERMLAELGHEVWIGDAAKIRASCERKQKTDRRDADLLRRLLAENRFPRIGVPTGAERDGRQLLLHRHKLVRMRTQVKNQLQALALNHGVQRKWKLWSKAGRQQLELLPLLPWASRRRAELLQLLDQLEASIAELDRAVAEQAQARPAARRLMTHPGVGPVTALAFTLTMGPAERFSRGQQVASYLGLIPSEHSSGGRQQRLGHISKQGHPFLRGLLVEAAQSAVRHEPEMRRAYQRLAQQKCRALAKVAMWTRNARKAREKPCPRRAEDRAPSKPSRTQRCGHPSHKTIPSFGAWSPRTSLRRQTETLSYLETCNPSQIRGPLVAARVLPCQDLERTVSEALAVGQVSTE